jgi:glycosyltransferase involved in cell wall biosynthesis
MSLISSKPLVSVLMNGYNCELYLNETIDSVYSQSYENWEIIFVDNMSSDRTADIVKKYDNKIKYYKTEKKLNLGEARNFGLSKCRGDYISFLDTDDLWLCEKLKKQLLTFQKNEDVKITYSSGYFINKDSTLVGEFKTSYNTRNCYRRNIANYEVNLQSLIFEKSILNNQEKIKFDNKLTHVEDLDLFLKIALKNKVSVERDKLVKYRLHEKQSSRNNFLIWYDESSYILKKHFSDSKIKKVPWFKEIKFFKAKVAYYKCRAISNGEINGEIKEELRSFKFINFKFFILYVCSYSTFLWKILIATRKI